MIEDRSVPCNGCNLCCRSGFSVRLTADDNPDNYPTLSRVWVGHKDNPLERSIGYELPIKDGECFYLANGKCSIYERRPKMCREFDCRDWLQDPDKILHGDKRYPKIMEAARARCASSS